MPTQAPYFIAFHSHEGGTGRTTVLTKTAIKLVERGFRVLAFDMNLTSPGFEYMEIFNKIDHKSSGFARFFNDVISEKRQINSTYNYLKSFQNFIVKITEQFQGRLSFIPVNGLEFSRDLFIFFDMNWHKFLMKSSRDQNNFWRYIKKYITDRLFFDYVLMDIENGFNDRSQMILLNCADMIVSFCRNNPKSIQKTESGFKFFRKKCKEMNRYSLDECIVISHLLHQSSSRTIHTDDNLKTYEIIEFDIQNSKFSTDEQLMNQILYHNPNAKNTDRSSAYINILFSKSKKLLSPVFQFLLGRLDRGEVSVDDIKDILKEMIPTINDSVIIVVIESLIAVKDDKELIEILKELKKLEINETKDKLLVKYFDQLHKLNNSDELFNNLITKLHEPFIDNAWYWAAFFAAKDTNAKKIDMEAGFSQTKNLISRALNNKPVEFVNDNIFRPGLDLDVDDNRIFWGRKDLIENIFSEKGKLLITGYSGDGRTWLLKKMHSLCGNQERAKSFFNDIDELDLPEDSFFIEGKKIENSILLTGTIEPFIKCFFEAIQKVYEITDEKIKDIKNFQQLIYFVTNKTVIKKKVALFIDDFDKCLEAIMKIDNKTYYKKYEQIQKFFEYISFELVCLSTSHDYFSKDATSTNRSNLLAIYKYRILTKAKWESIPDKVRQQLENDIEEIKNVIDFKTKYVNYKTFQSIFWGNNYWEKGVKNS